MEVKLIHERMDIEEKVGPMKDFLVCLFVFVFFFKAGFLCVALAVLEPDRP